MLQRNLGLEDRYFLSEWDNLDIVLAMEKFNN